jgi:hypothetical protein
MPGVHRLEDSVWLSPGLGARGHRTPAVRNTQTCPCASAIWQPHAKFRRFHSRWRDGGACSDGARAMIQSSWRKPPMLSASKSIRLPRAIVLCVDEEPSIQALERAQGYLKLPNGRAGKHPKVRFISSRPGRRGSIRSKPVFHPARPVTERRFLHHRRTFGGAPRGSSQHTTRPPSHSHGPRKRFTSGGSKIAVSLNSDSGRWRRVTAGRLRDLCANLDRSEQGGVAIAG